MSDLGHNIKKYRKAKKLTQDSMAQLLGIPRSTYAEWEGDNATEPKGTYLRKISEILEKSIDELYSKEGKNDVNEPGEEYKSNYLEKNTPNRALETVYSLAESNKTLVDSHKTLVETNADLVRMVQQMQKSPTVENELGIPLAFVSKFADLLGIVAELGVGKKLWKSPEEGRAELSRRFYADPLKVKKEDIVSGAGK